MLKGALAFELLVHRYRFRSPSKVSSRAAILPLLGLVGVFFACLCDRPGVAPGW